MDRLYEEKQAYIKKLQDFYINDTCYHSPVMRLDYEKDGLEEWVYVTYTTLLQKRFSIWGLNKKGIFKAFNEFLLNEDNEYVYPWLTGKRVRDKFTEWEGEEYEIF